MTDCCRWFKYEASAEAWTGGCVQVQRERTQVEEKLACLTLIWICELFENRGTAMLSKLRQLAKTAHQENSPPKKSAAGFLRPSTGAGKLPGTLPGSIQSPIGPNRVGQEHRVAKSSLCVA